METLTPGPFPHTLPKRSSFFGICSLKRKPLSGPCVIFGKGGRVSRLVYFFLETTPPLKPLRWLLKVETLGLRHELIQINSVNFPNAVISKETLISLVIYACLPTGCIRSQLRYQVLCGLFDSPNA